MSTRMINDTLQIELETKDSRYCSFTQYNKGRTIICLNGLDLEECIEIEQAILERKAQVFAKNETEKLQQLAS